MSYERSFPRRTSNARLRPQYEQLERRVLLANDLQLDLKSYSDYEQPTAAWFSRIDHEAAQAASIAAGGASTEWFDNFVGPRRYQQHDWIVRLTPAATASLRTLDELSSKLNQSDIEFRVVAGLGLPGLVHVQSLSNSEESVRTSLSHNDRIASFSANEKVGGQLVPNDSSFGNMTNLNNVGQFNATPDADIDTPDAWDRTTGSTKVVVGVIDSGVDAAHPDLYLNMWLNQGEIPSAIRSSLVDTDGDGLFTFYDLNQNANNSRVRDLNGNTYIDAIDLLEDPLWADGRDTDGNGFVDDFFGWNFRTDSNEPFAPNNPSDNLGHGTHVAGTIGAIGDNGRGIAGINWRSSIMALKFLDQSNQGELASAISAIHYATMMRTQFGANVRVLNNSWGQPGGENALLRDAIAESGDAGILFVAAAGNGNILGQGVDNDRVPFYPASYDLPNVIAVAASDQNDRLATFSNYGQRSVDIAAPGVGVLSTLPGGRYGEANGTSMATPHVSGVAALVWSEQFAATPEEVITAIKLGSDALPTLQSRVASGGRLNAPKALSTPVFAPAAILVSSPNITTATSQSQEIIVRYSHRDGINAQSIGDNDLVVLRRWGPKDSYYPTLKPGSVVPDGNGFRATYLMKAPKQFDTGVLPEQIKISEMLSTGAVAVTHTNLDIGPIGKLFDNQTDTLIRTPGINPATVTLSFQDPQKVKSFRTYFSNSPWYDPSYFVFRYTVEVAETLVDLNDRTGSYLQVIKERGVLDEAFDDVILPQTVTGRVFRLTTTRFSADNQVYMNEWQLFGERQMFDNPLDDLWDVTDYGAYEIQIRRNAIYGTQGLVVREGAIGQFRVKIDDPSVYYVNTVSDTLDANPGDGLARDSNGKTSLRAAIMEANAAGTSSRTIIMDPGFYFLSIAPVSDPNFEFMEPGRGATMPPNPPGWSDIRSGDLDVHGNISIYGDGNETSVIDAQLIDRVFKVHPGAILNLSRVAVQYGRAPAGQDGGAILSAGTLNVSLSTIANSSTQHSGGGIAVWQGAVNISRSTIWYNVAQAGGGMLLSNNSTMNMDGSTLAYNDAPKDGGAILSWFGGEGRITNSTISNNRSQGTGAIASLPFLDDGGVSGGFAWDDFVAFGSRQSSLVPGDDNKVDDIFIYDYKSRNIERISDSKSDKGVVLGSSLQFGLSNNRRFVVFSTSVQTAYGDAGRSTDLFVYDHENRTTESYDVNDLRLGRFVVYSSLASNLVSGDTNERDDVFVYDRQTRTTDRVSISNSGEQGNSGSYGGALSADGRFVAFESIASNLVPEDTNNSTDIFVYDRETRKIERVSVSDSGQQGNRDSWGATLSADGRYVAFLSRASNLVTGLPTCCDDTYGFIYDRQSRTIERSDSFGLFGPSRVRIEGQFVLFTAEDREIVIYDLQSRTQIDRISVPNGEAVNRRIDGLSISPDGRWVTFSKEFSNHLWDVFVFDRVERTLVPVTMAPQTTIWIKNVSLVENRGAETIFGSVRANDSLFAGNQQLSSGPSLDWGIGVSSGGYNLVNAAETYPVQLGDLVFADVMRWVGPLQDNGGPTWTHALLPGSPALDAGNPALGPGVDQRAIARFQDADGLFGSRSDIGSFEAYETSIQGSIFMDRNRNGTQDANEPGIPNFAVYLDENKNERADGNETVIWTATDNPATQIVNERGSFEFNLTPGNYLVAPQVPSGWSMTVTDIERFPVMDTFPPDPNWRDDSLQADSISADGRYVSFTSGAPNLWLAVLDRQTRTYDVVRGPDGTPVIGSQSTLSADGRFVAFSSDASNLVAGDTNNTWDVFVFDRQTRSMDRVSVSSAGEQGNEFSSYGVWGTKSISADGRFVAFTSFASNLVPGINGGVFVFDRQNRTIEGVNDSYLSLGISMSADGRFLVFGYADLLVFDRLNGTIETLVSQVAPTDRQITADGRYVVFCTDQSVVPGDTNAVFDIFVLDRQTQTVERVSVTNNGEESNGPSNYGSISADGRFVIFGSIASNLVPGDTNNEYDIFLYDRQSRTIELASVAATGGAGNGRSRKPVLSADGRFIAFASDATNLGTGDKDRAQDLFVRLNKRATGAFNKSVGLYGGQVVRGIDFGLVPDAGEIRGTAYIDTLANGVYEPGEPLRAGLAVYLDLNRNGRRETTEPTMVTGADGRYAFSNLESEMEYVIAVEVPANLSLIAPSAQTQGIWKVYLPAGAKIADRDFGFVPTNTGGQFENGTLSGRVFNDLNGDGIIQAGETGVPNITAYLDLNNNEVRDFNEPRTLTDPGGNYSFAGLGNRAYTVRTILPTGTSQSSPLGSKFATTTLPLTSASTQLANPQDVLAEDLNGDGWSDLATALYSGNSISIRLNNGLGSFASAPINVATAPEGLGPIAMATGRLNAGDAFDLITANQLNSTATIFLDFTGTGFASKQTLAVGNQPTDVMLGRFDEDSDIDAIVALKGTNQLVMLVNNGAGSFTKGTPFSSGGNQPTAFVTGFFNNDTILDIAVANYGTHPSGADFGNVAILLGRGDGTFNTPVTYGVGFGPISIASGDFNGDGFADLVTANFLANTATVLYGSASGAFTVDSSPLGVGQGPLQVSVADIEGDGDRDILVTNLLSPSISILRNRRSQGGGGFEPAESFGVAEVQTTSRLAFAAADFDRNTTIDIALVNSMSETLRIFNNTLVNGAQRIQSTGVDNLPGLNFGTRADVLLPKMNPLTNPESIVEEAPQQVIDLTGIAKGRGGGPALRITATSSDIAIVPHPTVDYVAGQATGQLRYTPNADRYGQVAMTVTLRDAGADQTLDTADDGVLSRMFTVSIKPVNDAPTFTVPRSRNTLEDSSAQVVSGFVTNIGPGPNESMQTLSAFGVTVDRPSLFSVQPVIDPDGTLRYTPALHAAGSAIVTVSLSDNGDTAYGGVKTRTDQFLIILDPVNDAPSITFGGKQTVVVGSPAQMVANFATGFVPGGGSDENTQTIAGFVIGVDKPEVFAVLPAISTGGTLTYTPSTTRTGTAMVSVQVRDSGGSANGGVDVSSIKTFEIEVTALPDTTAPTPTISATVPNPTNQASFDVNIDFGEPVTGFALTDLALNNATVTDLTDLAGGRYSLRMTAIANGIVSASIPASAVKDLANNNSLASATFTRTVDTVAPSVAIATTEPNPTSRTSFPITIQFSEPVLGFDASDVVLGNATLSNWSEPQPGRFTATLTALSDGVVFVGFSAGVARDAAGNTTQSPTPLIRSVNSGSSSYKPLLSTSERSPSSNKNWIAELDFGRNVSGFEASDLQITNGTATISDLGAGKYRIQITCSSDGDVTVLLPSTRVVDTNNKPNEASDPLTVRYVTTTDSDFGDAPAPYPTLVADGGPFHRRSALFLGSQSDSEPNGQPSVNATGDDANGNDDEDGIGFPMTLIVSPTTTTQSSYIVTSSGAGRLDAWIDFNGDGDWSDTGERIANALSLPAGRSIQSFTLPAGATPGTSYARFRLSSSGGLAPTGPATDGEVEDYAVSLVGGTGKELMLQADALGVHQLSTVAGRIQIGNQGVVYSDIPMSQISRMQGIETGGVVRYELSGIGDGLPGVLRYPGSAGMVALQATTSTMDVTQYGAQKMKGIEGIDLQSSVVSTLLITPTDVRAMNGAKRLRVWMNADDKLATTSTWLVAPGRIESGVWIQPYTQADATIEVVGARPWRNEVSPFDVDADQTNSPLDVLTLINEINRNTFPGGTLPARNTSSPSGFFDPDGDGSLSPLDVLALINELNRNSRGGGEGESPDGGAQPSSTIEIDRVMTGDMEELFPRRRSNTDDGQVRLAKLAKIR